MATQVNVLAVGYPDGAQIAIGNETVPIMGCEPRYMLAEMEPVDLAGVCSLYHGRQIAFSDEAIPISRWHCQDILIYGKGDSKCRLKLLFLQGVPLTVYRVIPDAQALFFSLSCLW